MEFRVLGPLEARRGGATVALPGGKPRAVLAFLLLHANEPVSAERLALALWGPDAPAGATRTVQVYVSRLRRALGDDELLSTSRAGYRLRVRPGELDLDRFERLGEDGRAALAAKRPHESAVLLREALGLWRGPALADLAFEPFAQTEIARLEEQRLATIESRIEADLAAGRHAELVGELQQLVVEHPLRERLHARLMLALYRTGRQADALQAYRRAREALVEQLGIEPGSELRALEQAVLRQDPALMADVRESGEAAARGEARRRSGGRFGRIPVPPTAMLGREGEVADLRTLIGDKAVRLVTVVGPPGVGKTRLAVELARAMAPELRDGAAFVSLAALEAFQRVASAIVQELGVSRYPGESSAAALARALGGRELLLVLDNFEHVLDAAPLIAELLAAAPDVTVLATSREPLRIRAERLFSLGPLALPPETADGDDRELPAAAAVRLFVAVARARDPDFTLSRRDGPAVVEICRRLDGLPLAIELAAGNLGLLSVADLAVRLRQRTDALGAGSRDAPRRHRTLSAALEWSYRLLTAHEQRTLEALAVFAGGCTADAAQAVTQAPLETLEKLQSKNLAVTDRAPNGPVRLRMLETVREFARARLEQRDDADRLRRRHCEHYVALAERTQPELRRSGSPELLAELDHELNNFRAAMTWALNDPAPILALRLASSLAFYMSRRRLEGEASSWLAAALALDADAVPAALRAAALEGYGRTVIETSTIDKAEAAARESLELRRSLGDRAGCAASMNTLCHVLLWVHRIDEAYRYAREAERLARESGDEQTLVDALHLQAGLAPTLEENLQVGERAAAADRAAGNRWQLAEMRSVLSYAAIIHGAHARAQQLGDEAVDAAEALDEPVLLAYACGNSGLAAVFRCDTERARAAFCRQLRLIRSHRHYRLVYEPLIGLAAAAATEGRLELAAMLHGAADASTLERPHPSVARQLDERCFAPARGRLGEQAWQAAYAVGTGLDRAQAIDAALGNARNISEPIPLG